MKEETLQVDDRVKLINDNSIRGKIVYIADYLSEGSFPDDEYVCYVIWDNNPKVWCLELMADLIVE
jgi:hypothetical protein